MSLKINHTGPHLVSPHELRAACSAVPAATCIPDVHVFHGGALKILSIECLMLIINHVKRRIVLKLLGFFSLHKSLKKHKRVFGDFIYISEQELKIAFWL